jgi:plasmid stabilization system protein ParE
VPRLKILPSAQADLVHILGNVTRASGELVIARRFVASLRQRCRDISALPGTLGRARPELRPDIRSFAYKDYVIFFRYGDGTLEIVNIIEGHRDIDRMFDDK